MIKLTTLVTAVMLIHSAAAQSKNEKFYTFDKNWKGVDVKKAVYFLHVRQLDSKAFEWTTYQMFGPRISQEIFQDEAGQSRNGPCVYYHPNGYLDSAGNCLNDLPTGAWWYYNNKGKAIRKKDYNNGVFVKDSVITPVEDSVISKAVAVPGEVESSFKGGQQSWMRFLIKNFRYPQRALDSRVEGMVVLQFIVDQNGKAVEPEINKSVEYSLDEEALRIINVTPNWNPASKDGKLLKSYKKQPIIFRLN